MTRVPTTDTEQKVLFAFAPAESQPDGIPTLVFLMTQKARDYMINGLSHDFDLTKIGIPLKVIIGPCHDHASGLAQLEKANGGPLARGFRDARGVSMEINPDAKPDQ